MPEDTEGNVQENVDSVQQTEQASTQEQVSTTAETPAEPSPEQKMAEFIQQKVTEEMAKATEVTKREIQSVKDKARAEVESALRRAKLAEGTMGAARSRLQELDPDVAKEVELTEYRAKEANRQTFEQEEEARRKQEAYAKTLQDSVVAHLESLGIDPKDKRIDWAEDSADYVQGRSRLDASVAKIVREERQAAESGLEKRLKDLEAKISKANIEANSVDTTTSDGVVAGSDAEFMKNFADGTIPLSKENRERYRKIMNS